MAESRDPHPPPALTRGDPAPPSAAAIGLAAMVGLVISAAGVSLYQAGASAFRAQRAAELEALADLKVDQVLRWRNERLATISALATDAEYMLEVSAETARPLPARQAEAWLRGAADLGDVTGVVLIDDRGEVVQAAGARPHPRSAPALREAMSAALTAGTPWMWDLDQDANGLHLELLAPLRVQGGLGGGIYLRLDPRPTLFPVIQSWPVPSSSVETLLLRGAGNGAQVLNPLRHRSTPPFELRLQPGAPGAAAAILAVKGGRGVGTAPDYRGVPSLTAYRRLPGTPWALLVKVDQAEAFAPLRERLAWAVAAALALATAAFFGVALWWRTRREAAERLREAAARERDALTRRNEFLSKWAYDMVFLVDDGLRVVEANERALEVLGYTRPELLAIGLRELREASTLSDLDAQIGAALAIGWGHWETRFRRKDGSALPVEVDLHVEMSEGRPWFHGIVRDVTERTRTEERLRASEARFRAAFDGLAIGMMLLDRTGRILETNRAMQAMLGQAPEQLRGRPASKFVHPEDASSATQEFLALRDGRTSMVEASRRYRRHPGGVVETQLRVVTLLDARGAFQYALAMVEDVSERRLLESQLRLADRMASMGTLAAGVAHEINNPLAFVLANLEFSIRELRREGGSGDVVAALEEAREGGTRVREIVRDLKTFSRADDATREPLDVGRVLRSALSLATNEIRARARLEVAMEPAPAVLGSEHRLGQVLLNLLINAAQAIPEGNAGGHLVKASTGVLPDGRVVVRISDDGAGIPPEVRSRIFDPFFTTKPVGVGTGLGLSICHGIVVGMGGEISVESEVGRGSTFQVILPPASAAEVAPPAPEAPATVGRRARVLVIDDEPLVCRAVQRILSPPHDVRVKGSGREALEALVADPGYDLVLCDLMMPEMTGMELHGTVAERLPELAGRFVFLTGGAFTAGAREFLQRIPNERVEKPFEPSALRELVARLVLGAPAQPEVRP